MAPIEKPMTTTGAEQAAYASCNVATAEARAVSR
jgi:hypothetical protein